MTAFIFLNILFLSLSTLSLKTLSTVLTGEGTGAGTARMYGEEFKVPNYSHWLFKASPTIFLLEGIFTYVLVQISSKCKQNIVLA